MAQWVRSISADITGANNASFAAVEQALTNNTAPGDFDPSAINSVRFQFNYNVRDAGGDDYWQTSSTHTIELEATGIEDEQTLASVSVTGLGDCGNSSPQSSPQSVDVTDNSPSTTHSTANWENAIFQTTVIIFTKMKGNDDNALQILASSVTITIDYTPDSAQTLSGALFTPAVSHPAGQLDLNLTGVLFTPGVNHPAGDVQLVLDGVLFAPTIDHPAGVLEYAIDGVLFTPGIDHPAGQLDLNLTGVLFTPGIDHPAGQLDLNLTGVLFTPGVDHPVGSAAPPPPPPDVGLADHFYYGEATLIGPGGDNGLADYLYYGEVIPAWHPDTLGAPAGDQTLTGLLFTPAVNHPAGQLDLNLTGVLFQPTVDHPAGSLDLNLTGVLFQPGIDHPAGQLDLNLEGALFSPAVDHPAGTLELNLTGVLFTPTIDHPAGQLDLNLTGVLFTPAIDHPAGEVNLAIDGQLFTPSIDHPQGDVVPGPVTLDGQLFQPAVDHPVGNATLEGLDQTIKPPPGGVYLDTDGYIEKSGKSLGTGDCGWVFCVAADDWNTGSNQIFFSQFNLGASNRTCRVGLSTAGALQIMVMDSTQTLRVWTTAAVGYTNGVHKWLKIELDVDDGAGDTYLAIWSADDPIDTDPSTISWGSPEFTPTNPGTTITRQAAASVPTLIGALNSATPTDFFTGDVYYMEFWDGFVGTGTQLLEFDPRDDIPVEDPPGTHFYDDGVDFGNWELNDTWTWTGVTPFRPGLVFPAGDVNDTVLTGQLFSPAIDHPAGQLDLNLTGVLFTPGVDHPAGVLGELTLYGNVPFTPGIDHPQGDVIGGATAQLDGVLFTPGLSFPAGGVAECIETEFGTTAVGVWEVGVDGECAPISGAVLFTARTVLHFSGYTIAEAPGHISDADPKVTPSRVTVKSLGGGTTATPSGGSVTVVGGRRSVTPIKG